MPFLEDFESIKGAKIQWLWESRIPLGRLTILEGKPGCGKSQLTMYIAAIASQGLPWPDGTTASLSNVVVLNAEDIRDSVIKPRLWAAGANLKMAHAPNLEKDDFYLPATEKLKGDIIRLNTVGGSPVKLIVLDPLDDFVPSTMDLNKSQVARDVLKSLDKLAAEFNLAVLVVRHQRKMRDNDPSRAGLGSVSIGGRARSAMMIGIDPSDENKRVMAPFKGNWAKRPPSLSFTIEEVEYNEDGEPIKTSRIKWLGESSVSAEELVNADSKIIRKQKAVDVTAETQAAAAFIKESLKECPRLSKTLAKEWIEQGGDKERFWTTAKTVLNGNLLKQQVAGEWYWSWQDDPS